MTTTVDPIVLVTQLMLENDELKAQLAEYQCKEQGIPEIVVRAIDRLNNEVSQSIVRLGSTLTDKDEKKAIGREIGRKLAAVGVLTKVRGEIVGVNRQWRIPSEKGDRFYIALWDKQSDLGACNCQAGANGHECKHVEAARALTLVSEVK